MTKLVQLKMIDLDDDSYRENPTLLVSVEQKYVNKINDIYNVWTNFWNGGEGYESTKDFKEEYAYIPTLLSKHFQAFHSVGLEGWTLETFVRLFNEIYPNANMEIVEIDYSFTFEY